jgi:phosphate transport system substrate-binding protein
MKKEGIEDGQETMIFKALKRQLPALVVLTVFLAVCVTLLLALSATNNLLLGFGLFFCLVSLGCIVFPAIHAVRQGFKGYVTVVVPVLFTLVFGIALGALGGRDVTLSFLYPLSFLYQELFLFLLVFFPLAVFGQGLGALVRLVLSRRRRRKAPDVLAAPDTGENTGRKRPLKALVAPLFVWVCLVCLASLLAWVSGAAQAAFSAAESKRIEEALASNNGMVADDSSAESFKVYPRKEGWRQIVSDSPFQLGRSVRETDAGANSYRQSYGTYPRLDGSTVCIPLAAEFARQHLGATDDEVGAYTMFNTTGTAYEHLISRKPFASGIRLVHWADPYTGEVATRSDDDGYCRLEPVPIDLFLGTEPSADELASAAQVGVELIKKPICHDAFVFITHRDNPVQSLTLEQVRAIYSGDVTNWKELGGNDEAIMAFQRQQNSGSQTAMENLVMKGLPMADPVTVKRVWVMSDLVDEVAAYHNGSSSIGYTYRAYIELMYPNEDIKTIAIEGIDPTAANVKSGAYPLSTSYFGVIRAQDIEGTGGRFLKWIRSEEGQRCVAQAGYIPLAGYEQSR